jgi:uncharacterized protein
VLIIDAGPLYASAAAKDKNHAACDKLLAEATGPLIVPHLIVAEVSYLLADRIGPHAEIAFANSIAAGELTIEPVLDSEWTRIAELMEQYADLPLGMADASLVALAERHNLTEIATLDHRPPTLQHRPTQTHQELHPPTLRSAYSPAKDRAKKRSKKRVKYTRDPSSELPANVAAACTTPVSHAAQEAAEGSEIATVSEPLTRANNSFAAG